MKLEDIYESFFDTYRNVGYIISEQSQAKLRRAAAAAESASKKVEKNLSDRTSTEDDQDYKATTALELNKAKLKAQSKRFKDAADKKAKEAEENATTPDKRERAKIVNNRLKATSGFKSYGQAAGQLTDTRREAVNVDRLKKRFKGEMDG